MRAIISETPGGPETLDLQQVPDPDLDRKQILVAIDCCSINFPDVLIIEDKYQIKPPRPFIPGAEISGIVESVGSDVGELKPGDRVCGRAIWGGLAEKIAIDERRCYRLPTEMPLDIGSGFLFTYGTAYYALKNRGSLKPGETVLVLGAAGGVGAASIELAKSMGARVVAAASTPEKCEVARSLGADETVCYPHDLDKTDAKALTSQLKAACSENGADIVIDPIGGAYAEAALRAIGPHGRYLVVGFTAGIPSIPLNLTLLKSCQIIGVNWATFVKGDPQGDTANTQELFDLYVSGKIRPSISKHYTLPAAPRAIADLAERRATGKIVVRVRADEAGDV